VVHQVFMPRHIDEADNLAARPRPIRKAKVDGDAARLLLLQPVGVDAGQSAHQRGLAMVDMSCGANDHSVASARSKGSLEFLITPHVCFIAQASRALLGKRPVWLISSALRGVRKVAITGSGGMLYGDIGAPIAD